MTYVYRNPNDVRAKIAELTRRSLEEIAEMIIDLEAAAVEAADEIERLGKELDEAGAA